MDRAIQVAVGLILGDGCLKQLSKRAEASQLYVSQHLSKITYLEWLHRELEKRFVMNPIKPKKGYNQHYFMTKPHTDLGELMKKFYPSGTKIVPNDIKTLLNDPVSLAVWYMDDGTLDRRSSYHFNSMFSTYGFSFECCQRLSDCIRDNFKVESSVTKCTMRGKIYPRLYVKSVSMPRFVSLIKPFIVPVFHYKVNDMPPSASSSGNT